MMLATGDAHSMLEDDHDLEPKKKNLGLVMNHENVYAKMMINGKVD